MTASNRRAASAHVQHGAANSYNFHIVFSGIVPLVREGQGKESERLWVLFPDFSNPSNLPTLPQETKPPHTHHSPTTHAPSHAHRSRLLAPEGCFGSVGRHRTKRSGGEVCQEAGRFDFLELANEHLTMQVPAQRWADLTFLEGNIHGPVPCAPGSNTPYGPCQATAALELQESDFGWVLDMDAIFAGTTKSGKRPPQLQPELFDPVYPPSGSKGTSLLSARFVFEHGEVTTRKLDRLPDGNYIISEVVGPKRKLIWRHVVATQVQLSLSVQSDVVLLARALDDPTTALDPIVITNPDGRSELSVFIVNEPVDLDCAKPDRTESHFHLNYYLLDRPEDLETHSAPQEGGPTLNAQCSPPKYTRS